MLGTTEGGTFMPTYQDIPPWREGRKLSVVNTFMAILRAIAGADTKWACKCRE